MIDLSGRTIGRYELQTPIGKGGMGVVYRGLDTITGDPVAIKALRSGAVAGALENLERFIREGEILRQLDHPNIVQMLAAFEQDDQHYIVMEYVTGGSLHDLLVEQPALPVERALAIALELADALTRAHHLHIIHRDLKPANALLAEDGTPRLTDFGLALMRSKAGITSDNIIAGTPPYLSPEAFRGDDLDGRTDIWALGVMLYQMLTGQLPFGKGQVYEIMRAVMQDPTPDLQALRPDIPVTLADLIYRMLVKERDARISSVRLVGAEIEAILRGTQISPQAAPELLRGEREFAFATPTPTSTAPRHNLPAQTTRFVDRENELTELTRLLGDDDVRLITILGPGGMGKTRLALEAAEQRLDNYPHGVYLVPLASLGETANIVPTMAEAVGFQFYEGGEPKQQLLDYFRQKEMLLVMDSFERLLDGAGLVTEVLQAAPGVKALVTSRERLKLQEETLFRIKGMDIPNEGAAVFEDLARCSAVELFAQGAQRACPGLELDESDVPDVARICRLVAGVPLGILLAAAWLDMFSVKEIADEISQSLDFLETETRNLPDRHRSIRAVFETSWERLSETEQDVFMRLAVFRDGFTRDAAQRVTGTGLRQLIALVNKSLLWRDPDSGRFDIDNLLRQYAEERLEASDQSDGAHDAHCVHFAAFLRGCEASLRGGKQLAALDKIEADFENVRAAWQWAVGGKRYDAIERMSESLYLFCFMRNRLREGEAFFRAAVAIVPDKDAARRAGLLIKLGNIGARLNQYTTAMQHLEEGLLLARRAQDTRTETAALNGLGKVIAIQGRYDDAARHLQQALALAQGTGNRAGIADSLHILYLPAKGLGKYKEAQRYAEMALEITQEIGDRWQEGRCLNNLAVMGHYRGDFAKAQEYFEQALVISREIGDRSGEGRVLGNLGVTEHLRGDYAKAQAYYEAVLAIGRDIGNRGMESTTLNNLGIMASYQEDYASAQAYCEKALEIYLEIGDRQGEGFVLHDLGALALAEGDLFKAETFFRQALVIRKELDQPHFVVEDQAGIARVALARGDPAIAREALAPVLAYLAENPALDKQEHPYRIAVTCGQVLLATGEIAQAHEIVVAAYARLVAQAEKLSTPDNRERFWRTPAYATLRRLWIELTQEGKTGEE